MEMQVGFIGAGKMAEAMAGAWIRKGRLAADRILMADVSEERRNAVARTLGVRTTPGNAGVVGERPVLVLAVKPQHLGDALATVPRESFAGRLVISILAGKRLASLAQCLPGARIVRVMPNLPCLVGEGMSAFCLGPGATAADREVVAGLLSCFGRVVEVPEEQFDVVTALSGSGPAFFAYVVKALADSAAGQGLEPAQALLMAEQTMLGTARLLREQGQAPAALIQSVASAKGTTAAGLTVLESSDVAGVLDAVLKAAAARSRELSA
jgi:pyrroline-5-carboxylate reductase